MEKMARIEQRALPIVIVGHVDHGKSTLIGRLFYDSGCLPADKLEEIRKRSEELGRVVEWAFIMDHLEEERRKGITIDIAHTFFRTPKRKYVIIDAPGHKEFLKNMITGSSQAEAALLLVDISEGIREQTRRHSFILSLLGIRQIAVVVNKMDLYGYSESGYRCIRAEIDALMDQYRIKPSFIVPISAREGENVAKRSGRLSWYHGPTVLEALDAFSDTEREGKSLRFPVQDVYRHNGSAIAVGRIESGTMRRGKTVNVFPEGRTCAIERIMVFGDEGIESAGAEECVGIRVSGCELRRGQLLADDREVSVTDAIEASLFWLINVPYRMGTPLVWRLGTQERRCRVSKIHKTFDPASLEVINEGATRIHPAEVAHVEIRFEEPVVVQKFSDIPELGRFVLEHEAHPVAGGIVL